MPEAARLILHRKDRLPALLEDAARETLQALHALSLAQTTETARVHAEMFQQYRAELEQLFSAYSVLPEPEPFEGSTPPLIRRRWDGVRLKTEGRAAEPLASLTALLEAIREVDADRYLEALEDAATAGFERELWMLALGGVEGAESLLSLAPEDWEDTLRGDGFAGVDWDGRLDAWDHLTQDKLRRWMGTAMLTGWTWEDTASGLVNVTSQHTNHVIGLIDNEIFRAGALGAALALALAQENLGADVRELWLARESAPGVLDPRVCPVCRAKHMTVTSDRPVDDTHPGCRCIKVPVPLSFTPVAPLSFESFRQEEG